MHTVEELQQFLLLDANSLDEALLQQPQLFWECSEYYSTALKNRDATKQVLEQGYATLSKTFRETSTDKVTESRVKEHVESHPQYVQQYHLYLQYKAEAERMSNLCDSFSQRISSIRELVALHVTGYWGTGGGLNEAKLQSYKEQYQANRTKGK